MTDDQTRARIEAALREKNVTAQIACAQALALAKELGVAPIAVGDVANGLGIKIRHCQLGCFGRGKK